MTRRAPERFLTTSRSCESGACAASMPTGAPRTTRGAADAAAAGSVATISTIGMTTRRNGYSRGFAAWAPPDLALTEALTLEAFAQMTSMTEHLARQQAGSRTWLPTR